MAQIIISKPQWKNPVKAIVQKGVYVPAISKKIAEWSNFRRIWMTSGLDFFKWYAALAENRVIRLRPYIRRETIFADPGLPTVSKTMSPNKAAIAPQR
jgi:hypothetical protein